jgi:hypothetical protein
MRVGKHDQQRMRAGLDHAHTLTARNNFAGWGDGPGMPASAAAFEDVLTDSPGQRPHPSPFGSG